MYICIIVYVHIYISRLKHSQGAQWNTFRNSVLFYKMYTGSTASVNISI